MKSVVITGSARGLGLEMAKVFRKNDVNVLISDIDENNLKDALNKLIEIESEAKVYYCVCNATNFDDIKGMIAFAKDKFGTIDIWINNAGVNQPEKAIWELDINAINTVIDVDLKGAIMCSNLVMQEMIKENKGAIYNIEGYGSNDAKMFRTINLWDK